jgi:hypothetical protein
VKGATLAGGFAGKLVGGTLKLDTCKLTATVTGPTSNNWVASGTAEVVDCTAGN